MPDKVSCLGSVEWWNGQSGGAVAPEFVHVSQPLGIAESPLRTSTVKSIVEYSKLTPQLHSLP